MRASAWTVCVLSVIFIVYGAWGILYGIWGFSQPACSDENLFRCVETDEEIRMVLIFCSFIFVAGVLSARLSKRLFKMSSPKTIETGS